MPIVTKRKSGVRPRRARRAALGVAAVAIAAVVAAMLATLRGVERLKGSEVEKPDAMGETDRVASDMGGARLPRPQGGVSPNLQPSYLQPSTGEGPTVQPPAVAAASAPARTNHVLNYRSGGRAAEHIKSAPDQILALIAQGSDFTGEMPPLPLLNSPDGGNAEFLASLTNEIAVLDGDPPHVRAQKEAIIDFRRQIMENIRNGGTFEESVLEYRDWVNECANLRLSALREYKRLLAEDPAAAEEWRASANAELEEAGATPIPQAGGGRRGRGSLAR